MAVESISASPVSQVAGAIQKAATATGASFQYLLATAQIESRLDPSAKAPTSTAQGLFQFIDQTWLQTLQEAGPAYGYTRYANAISQTGAGRYEITDPGMRNAIMSLRNDPTANALMAGAYTRNNSMLLTAGLGRQPTEGELYIAHFLGADGATRLISAATTNPGGRAADLFPGAAGANRSVFYDRAGHTRSVGDVYAVLTGRYTMARTSTTASGAKGQAATAPDTAGLTSAYADANGPDSLPNNEPIFEALFRSRERRSPVAPVVSSLWNKPLVDPKTAPPAPGSSAPTATAAPASAPANSQDAVRPLDLFRDIPVKMRGTFTGT